MSCLCLSLLRVQSAQEPINGGKYREIQYRANNKSNQQNCQNRETPLQNTVVLVVDAGQSKNSNGQSHRQRHNEKSADCFQATSR